MSLEQIVVRVRPQRVAVVLEEHTSWMEFMDAVALLSELWGGRYCPIIVANESDKGARARHNLARLRPEVVFLGSLDAKQWNHDQVADICQPRFVQPLERAPELLRQGFPLNLISAHMIVRADLRSFPTVERSNLILWETSNNHPLESYIAITFGKVPDLDPRQYASALKARYEELGEDKGVVDYIGACERMGRTWCWLDMASNGLSRHSYSLSSARLPTIIVVRTRADAALYWNMRSLRGVGCSATLIAFPEHEIENARSVQALAEWVHRRPVHCNGCQVLSETCARKSLDRLARRLRPRILWADPRSREFHVVVREPSYDAPVVIPFERQTHVRVFSSGSSLSLDVPVPQSHSELSGSEAWICDLVKDPVSGRAPLEVSVPPRRSAIEILNAPSPPTFSTDSLRLGFGVDSVNIRCSKDRPTERICLPTEEEMLDGVLRERGIVVRKDEKRQRYMPALELLGGLSKAAQALSGNSLVVLKAFLHKSKERKYETVKPPTLTQVTSSSVGEIVVSPRESPIKMMIDMLPSFARLVAERRFSPSAVGPEPKRSKKAHGEVRAIVRQLVSAGALRRIWMLDCCAHCGKDYPVAELHINPPMPCPGCSRPISIGESVQIGYQLNELLALAIREGVIPVVLAARFLRNLTHDGFQWLPGVKCSMGLIDGDLDILGCCDGHLVAAECKCREDSRGGRAMWSSFESQLERSTAIARAAGVSVFTVASLHSRYPKSFRKAVGLMAGSEMSVLFLTKEDLMTGQRRISRHGAVSYLRIDDVLPRRAAAKPRRNRRRVKLWVRYGDTDGKETG